MMLLSVKKKKACFGQVFSYCSLTSLMDCVITYDVIMIITMCTKCSLVCLTYSPHLILTTLYDTSFNIYRTNEKTKTHKH